MDSISAKDFKKITMRLKTRFMWINNEILDYENDLKKKDQPERVPCEEGELPEDERPIT